jgi:hypothetical protein
MITSTFLAATRSASCTRQLVETTTRPELGCPAQYGCEPGSPGETPLSLTAQDSTTQSNEQAPKRATRVTGHRGCSEEPSGGAAGSQAPAGLRGWPLRELRGSGVARSDRAGPLGRASPDSSGERLWEAMTNAALTACSSLLRSRTVSSIDATSSPPGPKTGTATTQARTLNSPRVTATRVSGVTASARGKRSGEVTVCGV